jgi:hypothetical protein
VCADWIQYVDSKRQFSFLRTLETLSGLQDPDTLNFIVIGALPLLIAGYLQYIVFWDFDLLFKDKLSLQGFNKLKKPADLRIVEYDDQLMVGANIASFHTAWTFCTKWINVDYILKKDGYDFYKHNLPDRGPWRQSIDHEGMTHRVSLFMAHPWDVITEKILSPRTARDLQLGVDTSVDIRHILAVFRKEGANEAFWEHLMARVLHIGDADTFKATFWRIIKHAQALGYTNIVIPDIAVATLGQRTT